MGAATDEDPVDPSDELVFTGLGGCNEVGRSCHIVQYKGKTVMVSLYPIEALWSLSAHVSQLDAGMYSGRDGIAALPYFDEFDLSTIDVLLISQYVPLYSPSISIYKSFLSTTEVVVLWIREKKSQMSNCYNVLDRDACSSIMYPSIHVSV